MHSRTLTSAVIDGRDFLRARKERRLAAHSPEGTPVIFVGGRHRFESEVEAKTYEANIWATLDKVRDVVPDLYLVHGGDTKGADRLAASWAERHEVQQLTFSLARQKNYIFLSSEIIGAAVAGRIVNYYETINTKPAVIGKKPWQP